MHKVKFITLLINAIFLIDQLRFFHVANENAPTDRFAFGFILCGILYAVALWIFCRFHTNTWKKLEILSGVIVLISMTLISLIANGIDVSMPAAGNIGYIILILGIIGYFKNRDKTYVSFIFWGIFVLLWTANWYESLYVTNG
ncbi:hypothetical protein LI177_04190 [bacterium 210820-DFI.6.37]|nr:hypothetical protein [bacterium 210820-DFI.6.37]